jgi:hypothetical protein
LHIQFKFQKIKPRLLVIGDNKVRERTKYSRNNQPCSIDEAYSRITDVETIINQIETQQGTKTVEAFHSENDFRDWHRKSSDAMAHFSTERDFLIDWIRASENLIRIRRNQERRDNLVKRINKVAQDIKYVTLYSDANIPNSIHEARERLSCLGSIESEYANLINTARTEGTQLNMSTRLISSVTITPVTEIKKVRSEINFLNIFIAQSESEISAKTLQTEKGLNMSDRIRIMRDIDIGMSYCEIMCWLVDCIDPTTGRLDLKDDEEKRKYGYIEALAKLIRIRDLH